MEEAKVSQQEIKFIAEFLDSFDLDEEIEYDEEGNDVRGAIQLNFNRLFNVIFNRVFIVLLSVL